VAKLVKQTLIAVGLGFESEELGLLKGIAR